ncbi:cholecystokinin receptor type A-like [Gigantopelta aegis]|uniref:cholecystokinin receptor type A-like n=1 Tax=Gigantopelta aegis TaxID=1735272 RepID=UPI001B88BE7C|nr:cholecystokinin receptor type A-like [Gigantopelta aegis]
MSSLSLVADGHISTEVERLNICCLVDMKKENCCQASSFSSGVWKNYTYHLLGETIMELPLYISIYVAIFNCVVFVVGIIGNVLVIQAVLRLKVMRTRMNYFLMSLSVADLLVLTVCQPSAMMEFYGKERWLIGEAMCKIVPFLENASLHSSILTLLTIGFERYCAICYPFRKQRDGHLNKTRTSIAAIWVVSYVLSLPFIFMTLQEDADYYDGSTVKVCRTKMADLLPRIYVTFLFCVMVLLPLALLTYMYSAIIWQLSRQDLAAACPGDYQNKKRRQVVRMMVYIIVLFFVCILPIRVAILLVVFLTPETMQSIGLEAYLNVLSCVRIMMYINSAGNPIIYGLLSTKFRESYRNSMPDCNKLMYSNSERQNSIRNIVKRDFEAQGVTVPCVIALESLHGTGV